MKPVEQLHVEPVEQMKRTAASYANTQFSVGDVPGYYSKEWVECYQDKLVEIVAGSAIFYVGMLENNSNDEWDIALRSATTHLREKFGVKE